SWPVAQQRSVRLHSRPTERMTGIPTIDTASLLPCETLLAASCDRAGRQLVPAPLFRGTELSLGGDSSIRRAQAALQDFAPVRQTEAECALELGRREHRVKRPHRRGW